MKRKILDGNAFQAQEALGMFSARLMHIIKDAISHSFATGQAGESNLLLGQNDGAVRESLVHRHLRELRKWRNAGEREERV